MDGHVLLYPFFDRRNFSRFQSMMHFGYWVIYLQYLKYKLGIMLSIKIFVLVEVNESS